MDWKEMMDNRINIEAERERVGRENAEFTEWWDRVQACPEHNLITQNAAHAAWQERARRTPADAVGAGELPPLPKQGDAHALAVAAKFDVLYDNGKGVHHYHGFIENVEDLIERAAIAADRAQRKQAALHPAGVCGIPTWCERLVEKFGKIPSGGHLDREAEMQAEIADLRAQLAAKGQGEPVARMNYAFDRGIDWLVPYTTIPEGTRLYAAPASAQPADPAAKTNSSSNSSNTSIGAHQRESAAEVDGWKLVPVEPTQAMQTAGFSKMLEAGKREVGQIYSAMLAAAPSAAAQPVAKEGEQPTNKENN
jgi:hypothetical protein